MTRSLINSHLRGLYPFRGDTLFMIAMNEQGKNFSNIVHRLFSFHLPCFFTNLLPSALHKQRVTEGGLPRRRFEGGKRYEIPRSNVSTNFDNSGPRTNRVSSIRFTRSNRR